MGNPKRHSPAAALAQRRVQVAQALQQELRAGTGRVAAAQQPVVEAEERDDAVVAVERRPQRGMVVDAQIAPEPDDGDGSSGHGAILAVIRDAARRAPRRGHDSGDADADGMLAATSAGDQRRA